MSLPEIRIKYPTWRGRQTDGGRNPRARYDHRGFPIKHPRNRLPYPKIMVDVDACDGYTYILYFSSPFEAYVLEWKGRKIGDRIIVRSIEDYFDYEGEIYQGWFMFIDSMVRVEAVPWFETPEDTVRINEKGINHREHHNLTSCIRDTVSHYRGERTYPPVEDKWEEIRMRTQTDFSREYEFKF